MKIIFAGGGTGGHFFPVLAVIQKIKLFPPRELEIIFIGPNDFGKEILTKENIRFLKITTGKLRRYFSLYNFLDIFKIFWGLFWCLRILMRERPDIVFGKGGYGSLPVGIAAAILKIPLMIHESDAMPGITNRILAYFAKEILISFPETKQFFSSKKRVVFLGNPLRESFFVPISKEQALTILGIIKQNQKPFVLFTGGSQGAEEINKLVAQNITLFLKEFNIVHIVGEMNLENYKNSLLRQYQKLFFNNYYVFPFLDERAMKAAYSLCDVVITRAGSGMIFEIAAFGKPSILIPLLNSAAVHQKENAYTYAKNGAALVIEKPNLHPHLFFETINDLIKSKEKLKNMGKAALAFAKPESAGKIAQRILNLAQKISEDKDYIS